MKPSRRANADTHGTTTTDRVEIRREFGSLRLRGRIWWLRYRVDGKEHAESSHSTSKREAEKLLERRQTEFGLGTLTPPDASRVRFSDLKRMLRHHYRVEGLRSSKRMEGALAHLSRAFDSKRAIAITREVIKDYQADRLEEGAARATINYELAMLKKAFNLAMENGRLLSTPKIKMRVPRNARTGFFEPDDFEAVFAELPKPLQAVMRFAYLTGWRVRDEVLPLTWDRVDFRAGVFRLNPNTTKNDEGRTFPFDVLPDLALLLRTQRDETKRLEHATGDRISHVFHRNGVPIKDYYHAWRSACRRASKSSQDGSSEIIERPHLVGRIAHDFRRTAVRNLVRAGVPEAVAMKLTGHKTRAVFDRYNITNEADLRAGVTKLATHLGNRAVEDEGTTGGQSSQSDNDGVL